MRWLSCPSDEYKSGCFSVEAAAFIYILYQFYPPE
jgi:hypothetical protein